MGEHLSVATGASCNMRSLSIHAGMKVAINVLLLSKKSWFVVLCAPPHFVVSREKKSIFVSQEEKSPVMTMH